MQYVETGLSSPQMSTGDRGLGVVGNVEGSETRNAREIGLHLLEGRGKTRYM
jgi:hypothetical protein